MYTGVSKEHNASIFRADDGGSIFHKNADTQPEYYTAQQPLDHHLFSKRC
jgi:hypothetical protein